VPGNLSGRVLARERDRWETGGTEPHLSRCLLFVCSSLEAFGLLGATKRGRSDRESSAANPQTKHRRKGQVYR